MFFLVKRPIIPSEYFPLNSSECGGMVFFEGRVRNSNLGKEVISLSYDAYEEMALLEGKKILQLAKNSFSIEKAYCVHRLGDLAIQDLAIWIGVYSKHRKAAFGAAEYIIDEVKKKVPIWKKEFYKEGDSSWVECLACKQDHHEQHTRHYHHDHHHSAHNTHHA